MPNARPGCFAFGVGPDWGAGPGCDAARTGCGLCGLGDLAPDLVGEFVPDFEPDFGGLKRSVEEVERVCICGNVAWRSLAGIVVVS